MFGLAWLTVVGFQTMRDVRIQHRAPLPSEYVASSAIFALLALGSGNSPERARVATAVAWGFVVAVVIVSGGPAKLLKDGAPGPLGILTPNAPGGQKVIGAGVGGSVGKKPKPKGVGGGVGASI